MLSAFGLIITSERERVGGRRTADLNNPDTVYRLRATAVQIGHFDGSISRNVSNDNQLVRG
ncbi:hypothetical protein D3C72_2382230 [compost metagenome]